MFCIQNITNAAYKSSGCSKPQCETASHLHCVATFFEFPSSIRAIQNRVAIAMEQIMEKIGCMQASRR
eukprot:scaffold88270_cov16-Tisochrysis_lutea.AAC.1